MRFRKKPVEIEAMCLTDEAFDAVLHWCLRSTPVAPFGNHGLIIHTLEGDMRAEPGDWIIKGVKGEFYPCKPDIFEATYEPANPTNTVLRASGPVPPQVHIEDWQ